MEDLALVGQKTLESEGSSLRLQNCKYRLVEVYFIHNWKKKSEQNTQFMPMNLTQSIKI
jgi:hypothetical protein